MPTLYVERVPDELCKALRERARKNRKSIAAEVLTLLEENAPTAKELARRKAFLQRARKLRARRAVSAVLFPATEEMQREDRLWSKYACLTPAWLQSGSCLKPKRH
jgi:hypothetical protein